MHIIKEKYIFMPDIFKYVLMHYFINAKFLHFHYKELH